jgi:uncharacterized protein (TIGR03086 family)
MSVTGSQDPRPQLDAALDQVHTLIEVIGPDDGQRPTPCPEFDVRTLVAHLVAVMRKLTVVRAGGEFASVPDPAEDLGAGGKAAFERARQELRAVWEDSAALDAEHTLPYGTLTGRELLDAYAHEFTVHAWDLHRALDAGLALDPALSEAALDWYRRNVPVADRGTGGPFGAAVEVADEADVHTRLAALVGRRP